MNPILSLLLACTGDHGPPGSREWPDHGPMAPGIYAALGQPAPYATEEQLATFQRGHDVALRRFSLEEGLGPAFNVTFCAACHERPTVGGSAGLYRNFFLGGRVTEDGAFLFGESAGNTSGVLRMYAYGDEWPARPPVPDTTTIFAQRNPIPFFGMGLLAELTSDEILKRADEEDLDGDGVSGRPNWDRGYVGRFGMKSQTTSIEGFIRGPLFNHLGVTTDPLTEEQRSRLPVDSSGGATGALRRALSPFLQAAAPDGPLVDDDLAADPEMSTDDLFDLVSFAMLLGAPEPEPLDDTTRLGQQAFDVLGCATCHTPRIEGPRGPLPVYSDLLLHDMGPDLADGLVMKEATGSEFRSQPLWGLAATGPYLHDGRAATLDEAIAMHGGEATEARDRYLDLEPDGQAALLEFLTSLGGRDQVSEGLVPPATPIAPVGAYGGPDRELTETEQSLFLAGRSLFDRDFALDEGTGGPRFNADSCRACHFDPVVGGAGPRDVNVLRHGLLSPDGSFVPPAVGTVLHKQTSRLDLPVVAQPEAVIFEHRQTPPLFGLGLVGRIPDAEILANADPDDLDGDGISGKASWTDGHRLGRFGWKDQVPTVDEFVRDAFGAEIGLTLTQEEGLTFGVLDDNDDASDPELALGEAHTLAFYLSHLAPPPRGPTDAATDRGEEVFGEVGCGSCHVPSLAGPDGPVPLFSDLLLHEILPPGALGIEDTSATMREFRTAPLWGLGRTAPYLHTGEADTIEQAIEAHDGEATAVRDAFLALPPQDRDDLLAFLGSL